MAEMIGGDRPMRTCIGCGQTDDHPRCIVQITATEDVTWHPDCHQIAAGDMDCHPQCAGGAHEGKTGLAMLQHIIDYHGTKGA